MTIVTNKTFNNDHRRWKLVNDINHHHLVYVKIVSEMIYIKTTAFGLSTA